MLFQHEVDDTLARGFAVLRRGLWLEHGEPLERLGGIGEDRAVEAGRLAVDQDHRFLAAGVDEGGQAGQQVLAAIGRAACRGRVCKYVSISVVAGSLKNKQRYLQRNIDECENT